MEPIPRLAGSLLQGASTLEPVTDGTQLRLFEFLRSNQVLLFESDPDSPRGPSRLVVPALRTPLLAPQVKAEREACDSQRVAFLEAQEILSASGLPLLLFKTIGPYPYTSSNVDALVHEGDLDRAAKVMSRAGYHEMAHYWEPNKRLFHRFEAGRCTLKLHLHERVSWLVLSFIGPNDAWANPKSSSDPLIRHPADECVVAALLAHTVYESNRVSLGDLWKIRQAVLSPEFSWDEVLGLAARRYWLPGLALACEWYSLAEREVFGDSAIANSGLVAELPEVPAAHRRRISAIVEAGRWPLRVRKNLTKRYFFRKLLRDDGNGLRKKAWDLAGIVFQVAWGRLGLRCRPASLVCICGIDGSGKTTHAEALIEALRVLEVPCRRVWMRGGYSPGVETMKRLLRRSSRRVPAVGDQSAKSRMYRGRLTGVLWAWLVAMEQVMQSIVKVRLPLWRARTVVTERYVPDTLVDLTERSGDAELRRRMAARVMRWAASRPDLLILLDLPGKVAFARKPDDFDESILEARRRIYRAIVDDHPGSVVLDGTRDLDSLKREILDRSLTLILGRFGRENPLNRQRRDAWNESSSITRGQ